MARGLRSLGTAAPASYPCVGRWLCPPHWLSLPSAAAAALTRAGLVFSPAEEHRGTHSKLQLSAKPFPGQLSTAGHWLSAALGAGGRPERVCTGPGELLSEGDTPGSGSSFAEHCMR